MINKIVDTKILQEMLDYDPYKKAEMIEPTSWEQLEVGMEVELLPISKGLGWQKGILRYNKGYKDPYSEKSILNLSPFWYILARIPGHYGPITLMLKELSHIKIPKNVKSKESTIRHNEGSDTTDSENTPIGGQNISE